ncbi:Uncharacterised protein [Mycobacteroides abscessus subsp. abscessus]|nr:Uncharacterised protein [Mycobacteroides abscessus subsp. abscessus]SIE88669.1 Uncharacterised protein [Mycobacteroides abscessus subsp. abscessus]SII36656.1 Uncharacterised protein [Mycobacteroides abscessus subsp. abscessus]SKW44647.1 Uncharacterised protein [Mycobacteroides abscessus subsp. abscessus]
MWAVIRYWSLGEFADEAGLTLDTMKGYLRKKLLPPHQAQVGRSRGWLPERGRHWIENRPSRDEMEILYADEPVARYWSLGEFADEAGLKLDTMKGYLRMKLLPPHQAQVGRSRGWLPERGRHWMTHRRGRGARTDLYPVGVE